MLHYGQQPTFLREQPITRLYRLKRGKNRKAKKDKITAKDVEFFTQ